jgi:hypothetical protein
MQMPQKRRDTIPVTDYEKVDLLCVRRDHLPDMWIAFEKKYAAYAISTIIQLSVFGKRRMYVNLSRSDVTIPISSPIAKLPKKTNKKMPILSNKASGVKCLSAVPSLYF